MQMTEENSNIRVDLTAAQLKFVNTYLANGCRRNQTAKEMGWPNFQTCDSYLRIPKIKLEIERRRGTLAEYINKRGALAGITKEAKAEILFEVAKNGVKKIKDKQGQLIMSNPTASIAAVRELNLMVGHHAPTEIKHSLEVRNQSEDELLSEIEALQQEALTLVSEQDPATMGFIEHIEDAELVEPEHRAIDSGEHRAIDSGEIEHKPMDNTRSHVNSTGVSPAQTQSAHVRAQKTDGLFGRTLENLEDSTVRLSVAEEKQLLFNGVSEEATTPSPPLSIYNNKPHLETGENLKNESILAKSNTKGDKGSKNSKNESILAKPNTKGNTDPKNAANNFLATDSMNNVQQPTRKKRVRRKSKG